MYARIRNYQVAYVMYAIILQCPLIRKCIFIVECLESTAKFNKALKRSCIIPVQRATTLNNWCYFLLVFFVFSGSKPPEKLQEQNKKHSPSFHSVFSLPLNISGALCFECLSQILCVGKLMDGNFKG
jgi:hypothetical protein